MIRTCSGCLKPLAITRFSKTQLRKHKDITKCKDCVDKVLKLSKSSSNIFTRQRQPKRNYADKHYSRAKRHKTDTLKLPARYVKHIKQLGDGNCLYRSLTYGLNHSNLTHLKLRKLLARWVKRNAKTKVNGTMISKWIKWEKCCNVQKYCTLQSVSSIAWGGQIELCAFSHLFSTQIDIFEFDSFRKHYVRVTSFPSPRQNSSIVNLLYINKNHYDALVITK